MGMSITADLCIGVVVIESENDIKQDVVTEEILEEQYEGYFEEYLYDKVEDDIFEIVTAGTDDYRIVIIALKEFTDSAGWCASIVNIDKYSNIDIEEKIKVITDKLDSLNINYGEKGLLLSSYFSH